MTTTDNEVAVPLGPDDEIWDGGPTMADVDRWKARYGADSVYVTSLTPSYHVVWRTLNRVEYRDLVRELEESIALGLSRAEANMDNEERIAARCVLYPPVTVESLRSDLAGLPSLIAQEVMEASGFNSLEIRQL